MQALSRLEIESAARPNSVEINQALADSYAQQGRWEEAARVYRALVELYPTTALLFVNRIRLGALALAAASALILLAEILQPAVVDARISPTAFAAAVSSKEFLWAQLLFALALPLWSTAAISTYKLLSYSHAHRPAFWAMVLSVIGVGLSMPALGINAIVLPQVGRLYLEGQANVLNIYLAVQVWPWPLALRVGGFLLALGLVIFNVVIWSGTNIQRWGPGLLAAGWMMIVYSDTQLLKPGMLTAGLLVALGGIWLARNIWTEASLQFAPRQSS